MARPRRASDGPRLCEIFARPRPRSCSRTNPRYVPLMVAADPTPVPPDSPRRVGALRDDALCVTTATPPRDPEAPPHASLSASERSLLSAVLNPTHPAASIDPLSLAAALKNPA